MDPKIMAAIQKAISTTSAQFWLMVYCGEGLIIAYLYLRHLFLPWRRSRYLIGLRHHALLQGDGSAAKRKCPSWLKWTLSRLEDRRKQWSLSRIAGSERSYEPVGAVFRPEEFYFPRITSAAPGMMAGLGILGTFIGLAVGVKSLDLTTNETLRVGLQGLLNGLNIAVWTSVLGISAGVLFTWWSRRILHHIDEQCRRLNMQLAEEFPAFEPGEVVKALCHDQREILANVQGMQTEFIQNLADALFDRQLQGQAQMQATIANGLSDGIVGGIKGTLNDLTLSLNRAQTTLNPLLDKMGALMQSATVNFEQQQAAIERLDELLPALVNSLDGLRDITHRVGATSDKLLQTASEQIGTAYKMQETVCRLSELGDHVRAASGAIAATGKTVAQITERFDRAAETFSAKTDEKIRDTLMLFDQQLASVAGKLVGVCDQLADSLDALPHNTERLVQTLASVRDRLAPVVDGTVSDGVTIAATR